MTDCDQQRGEALHHATSLALHGFIPPDAVVAKADEFLKFLRGEALIQRSFGGDVVRTFPRGVTGPTGTALDGVLSVDDESPTETEEEGQP